MEMRLFLNYENEVISLRLFINMNTLLYDKLNINSEEDLMTTDFYNNVKENKVTIKIIQQLLDNNFGVYILSYALFEKSIPIKKKWIKEKIPKFKAPNIIICSQNTNYFNLIKGILTEQDIYLDINEKLLNEFKAEGGTGIYYDKSKIKDYDTFMTLLKEHINSYEEVYFGKNKYIHYQLSFIDSNENYEGFKKIRPLENSDSSRIFDDTKKLIDKNYVMSKYEITEFSYLTRVIIKNILSNNQNISENSENYENFEYYELPFQELNKIIKSTVTAYDDITEQILLSALNEDIGEINKLSLLNEKKDFQDFLYIKKDKKNLIVSKDIIDLFDFYQEKKIEEEVNRLKIEYFLTKSIKIKQEIEKVLFAKEMLIADNEEPQKN